MRGASARTLAVVAGVVLAGLVLAVVLVVRWQSGRAGEALAMPTLPPPTAASATSTVRAAPSTSAGSGPLTKLTTTVLIPGDGPAIRSGQQVTVHYLGVSYNTGATFDSSWTRGEPFTFTLGANQLIQGWEQGLPGAKVGSRIQLDIPPSLAYGDSATGGRPSGPLRFIIDILAAK